MTTDRRIRPARLLALTAWGFLTWLLLTWTATVEVLLAGAVIALATACVLAPLGGVVRPWVLLRPRRLLGLARLTALAAGAVVRANLQLSRLIWQRHPRLRTGMVIAPTRVSTDGGFAAVGLLTSLIVDNQVVDADPDGHELLYHVLQRPSGGRAGAYEAINGPVEHRILDLDEADQRAGHD